MLLTWQLVPARASLESVVMMTIMNARMMLLMTIVWVLRCS